jgi:hypothetical protein
LKSWSRSQQCAREGKGRKEDERLNRSDHKKRRRRVCSISEQQKKPVDWSRGLNPKERKKKKKKIIKESLKVASPSRKSVKRSVKSP